MRPEWSQSEMEALQNHFAHSMLFVKPTSCVAGVQSSGQARARVATTEVQALLSSLEGKAKSQGRQLLVSSIMIIIFYLQMNLHTMDGRNHASPKGWLKPNHGMKQKKKHLSAGAGFLPPTVVPQ